MILDQFGNPILQKNLKGEIATAETSGVRQAVYDVVSAGLTPSRLAQILRGAAGGDADDYLSLAEDMEERYLHYAGVLSSRKRAVSGAPIRVEPFDDSPLATEIATSFDRTVAQTPIFREMLFDLLDALGKGYAVVEMIWDTTTKPWSFSALAWRDPHWFHFDRTAQTELRLRDTNYEGLPLPGGKFLVHTPRIKSGLPIRGGLARMAAIAFMAQNYTLKDWLAFMEVYGMPLRIGKYDPNSFKEPERMTLRRALSNLGHDAAAMIPVGMDIEIVDINRGSGVAVFSELADYLDKQVSKGILGQTMTTDDGSSLAQARVHGDVKQEFCEADAFTLASTIQAGLVRPWVQLNYGENAPVCRLVIDVSPPEDLKSFTDTVLPWVRDVGLRVGAQEIRDKFGVSDPDETGEEEILGGRPEPDPDLPPEPEVATNRQIKSVELTDDLILQASDQWERVMEPHRVAINALAESCETYEEFRSKLDGLVSKFDSDPFVKLLAETMAKARGLGGV